MDWREFIGLRADEIANPLVIGLLILGVLVAVAAISVIFLRNSEKIGASPSAQGPQNDAEPDTELGRVRW